MNATTAKHAVLSTVLLAAATLLCFSVAKAGPRTDDASRPGAARPGWYLGVGVGAANLSLDDAVESRFSSLNLELSDTGQGGSIFVGYSFHNRLNVELTLLAREFSTGRNDIDASLGALDLQVIAPLLPEARVSPYLAGSAGAGALAFSGAGIDDKGLVAGQVGIGAGLEVQVSRRFAVDFHYRVMVQHYQQEVLTLRDGGDSTIDFDGSGLLQLWGMRLVFSF